MSWLDESDKRSNFRSKGRVLKTIGVGGEDKVLLVKLDPSETRTARGGGAQPGYYVVMSRHGVWSVLYGPLATRGSAVGKIRDEIGYVAPERKRKR